MSRAHSPSFPLLYLCHSSFSKLSVSLPTSQFILQPFRRFTYVTAHSPTLLSLLLHHRLFTYVTWRAAHGSQLTSLKSILILPSHLRFDLTKGLFLSIFPNKTLYSFLNYSIRSTCPAHLGRLDLRFLILLDEEYNACSSALCNFLHSTGILSLLAPNIFLSTLFWNTVNLCSSLKVRDQVSQTYDQ